MHQSSESNFPPRSEVELGSIAPKPVINTRCWRLFLMLSCAFYIIIGVIFLCFERIVHAKATDYTLFMETRAIDLSTIFLAIALTLLIIGSLGFNGVDKRRVKILIVFNILLACVIVAEIVIVSIAYSLKDEIQEALEGYTIRAKKLFGADERIEFSCCGFQGLEHYRHQTGYLVKKPDFCYSFLEYDNDAYQILKETGQCPPLFESYVKGGWSIFIVVVLIVITIAVLQVLNLIFVHKLIKDLRRKEKLLKRSVLQLLGLTYVLEKYTELRNNGPRSDPSLLDEEENVTTDGRDEAPIRVLGERSQAAYENRREHTPTVK